MRLIFAAGLYYGNAGVAVNATVGVLVTLLPGVLERRYALTMNVGIVLWITLVNVPARAGDAPRSPGWIS